MPPLEVAIIGAGPSGLLAADKLLGTATFESNIHLIEKSQSIGGIPSQYSTVSPNSPFHDLYSFLMDLRAEEIFSDQGNKTADKILQQAKTDPSLAHVASAFQLLWDDLLSKAHNSRLDFQYGTTATKIIELSNGQYHVELLENIWDTSTLTVDVIISAIGGELSQNPYNGLCESEIDLKTALDAHGSLFKEKKVVIVGASHSAAIAFINAVNQGAKQIEVWYQNNAFREHRINGNNIKEYQFSGINEPTLSRLKKAMAQFSGRYQCKSVIDPQFNIQTTKEKYQEWCIVPALGFKKPSLPFYALNGKVGQLENITQGEHFLDCAPNLCYPGTNNPIPRIYGLGLAYPLEYTQNFLENTHEIPGAKIVGIYFTNELTKYLVPDILQNWPEHLIEQEDDELD